MLRRLGGGRPVERVQERPSSPRNVEHHMAHPTEEEVLKRQVESDGFHWALQPANQCGAGRSRRRLERVMCQRPTEGRAEGPATTPTNRARRRWSHPVPWTT